MVDAEKETSTNEESQFKSPGEVLKKKAGGDTEEQPAAKKPKVAVLKHEATYLRSIPASSQYEKSFMHRDVISHVIATETDFIITASVDGHLKFWKKKYAEGVEFVKHFRCHLTGFSHICANFNGTLLATVCSQDKMVKIFEIENFDMINILKFDFTPRLAAWIHQTVAENSVILIYQPTVNIHDYCFPVNQSGDMVAHLAVTREDDGTVVVVDAKGSNEPIFTIDKIHSKPIRAIEYLPKHDIIVSCDDGGMVEYWSGPKNDFNHPKNVTWESKLDTDLYEYMKVKTLPVTVAMSPSEKWFAIFSEDRKIRIFDVETAKIVRVLDETLQKYISEAKANKHYGLQNMEWNRRVAGEKDLDKDRTNSMKYMRMCWDHSGYFLMYPSPTGVKVYNVVTDTVVRQIGREETVRFMGVTLCRAVPNLRARLQGAATTMESEAAENPNLRKGTDPDPIMVAFAHKKNRFFLFTNTEPFSTEDGDESANSRDIFNEKPKKEDQITAVDQEKEESKWSDQATVHTSFGDIKIKLFPVECPRTVENFCTLSRRGYYNGLSFHRVIKSFMVQTGDPTGKGTGGESCWGADFEDEFHPRLRHEKPFMVSMANAGPNSNGSQFFITVCPAEWLDGKNTLFGEVIEGMNVVQKINVVPTYEKSGRPRTEINIISVSLK